MSEKCPRKVLGEGCICCHNAETELSRLKEKIKELEMWMQNCPNCNELLRLKELVAVYEEALKEITKGSPTARNNEKITGKVLILWEAEIAQSALSRGERLKGG